MATIVDVANAAQVSVATVSRVLNDSYAVTDEKKRRVMEAIEAVGYQIPARMKMGKQLNNNKSVILIISSILIESIILPFQKAADEWGYRTIVTYYGSKEQMDGLEQLINTLDSCIAGILLINAADNSPEFQALVSKYPLVQIGEPILEDQPNYVVYTDEIKMSQDATNYLLKSGCKKIGALMPEPKHLTLFSQKKRVQGYYLALLENGLAIDESLVVSTDITIDGGYDSAKKLLKEHPDIDAILGCCDVVSQGAMYAAMDAGHSGENSIAIFSMDRNEMWDYIPHFVSYIDPHHDEMAATAARLLHSVICGETTTDYRVVIRHTLQCSTENYNCSFL